MHGLYHRPDDEPIRPSLRARRELPAPGAARVPDARGRGERPRGRAVLRRRRAVPHRRGARPRAVAAAAAAAVPAPAHARCPTTRAGRSGSTTTASTSRTTCGTPRCRSPGSWEQLVALTTRVQEGLLDRERPLWELWFVEGLEGGNVALIQKTHHSLVDGVSGVDVATLLLDLSPELRRRRSSPSGRRSPRRARRSCSSTRCASASTEPAEIARSVRSMLRGPRHALERAQRARAVDEHDGRPRLDRAAHVDQRAHRSAPAARRSCASRSPT